VDAVGESVAGFAAGDRVTTLTTIGGHAEFIYLTEGKLVCVPDGLDATEAVTLISNYLVAFQVLHRVAKVKTGDKVLLKGKIKPIIATKFALLQAAKGYELLQSGHVTGDVVLLAPELL
jgi:NADPH:quinone reductase-like Zn-dependent oxidoreductase